MITVHVVCLVIHDYYACDLSEVLYDYYECGLPVVIHDYYACDLSVVLHDYYACDLSVVVTLLFYVHGKHLRSCRDGQLN